MRHRSFAAQGFTNSVHLQPSVKGGCEGDPQNSELEKKLIIVVIITSSSRHITRAVLQLVIGHEIGFLPDPSFSSAFSKESESSSQHEKSNVFIP